MRARQHPTGPAAAVAPPASLRAAGAIAAIALALGLVPAVVVMGAGSRGFFGALGLPGTAHALALTLGAGALALLVVALLGTPTAWALSRTRHRLWRRLGLCALAVPLLMPPLVLGLALAFLLGPAATVGQWLQQIGVAPSNSWFALVAAQVYEAFPYFVMTAWAGFEGFSPIWTEVAAGLGKSPAATLAYVVLPMTAPTVAVALAMAWARVTGAFGAVIVVAYHPTALPVGIWITLEEYGLGQALPLALWLVAVGLPVPLGLTLLAGDRGNHVVVNR